MKGTEMNVNSTDKTAEEVTEEYWLLLLSKRPSRLFRGRMENLTEVTDEPFPMDYTRRGGKALISRGRGVRKASIRDEFDLEFFREVRKAFEEIARHEPLPLAIAGVRNYVSVYREISEVPVTAVLEGNHDRTPVEDLGRMVWALLLE